MPLFRSVVMGVARAKVGARFMGRVAILPWRLSATVRLSVPLRLLVAPLPVEAVPLGQRRFPASVPKLVICAALPGLLAALTRVP